MDISRLTGSSSHDRSASPNPNPNPGQVHVPGQVVGDPSLKLPPLMRDHPLPNAAQLPLQQQQQQPPVARTMHQIQLAIEYNVEEAENRNAWSALPSLTEGLARLDAGADAGGFASSGDPAELEREIHALCVFDPIVIPPSAYSRTLITDALRDAPIRRRWGRWRWRGPPDLSSMRVVEAVMVYERGFEVSPDRRCTRCRAGEGLSPQCVVPSQTADGRETGPCSNCLYDGWGSNCSVSQGRPSNRDEDAMVDHMAVLELIAGLKRPTGTNRDHSLQTRARRIETAALHIAQAAREWGEKMTRQN